MYTIYDYLLFYKDKNIEKELNDIDLLFLTLLSYLPIDSFNGVKNFNEFIDYAFDFRNNTRKGTLGDKAYDLLDIVKDGKRYKDLKIFNPLFVKNNNTQYGSITFRINNNTIISYKGTDNSFIGWIENFRLSYKYPTYTQNIAYDYLKDNINIFDRNIYLVGHSKGGNLALSSLYLCNNSILNRIKKVINFDGPGLRYDEFNSERFNEISNKLVNYIPSGSIVGVLMNNKEYNVIKSNDIAWKQHYPTSWQLFGEFFLSAKLSNTSKKIHNTSTVNVRNLEYEKLENAFEKLYSTLGKDYQNDISFNYNDLKRIIANMKNIDSEIAKYLENVVNSILKFNEKK